MSARKPNVLFFMVDQLAARWLEVASAGVVATPNFDRLRQMGTTFTNCISSNPLCCPARATLATGLTTRGHGVLQNGYTLDPELPTFMRILQQGGWRTAAVGKLHLRPDFETSHPNYKPYGFDIQHITGDDRGGEWLDWVRTEHPEYREDVYRTIWSRDVPDFASYGESGEDLRAELEKVPTIGGLSLESYELPFPAELSQTNWITGHALDIIRNHEWDQPLYVHVSYVQPHNPFTPPVGYRQFVDTESIPDPIPPEWPGDALAPDCLEKRGRMKIPENWRTDREHYFADLCHLDQQLGRVLDALKETGQLSNTYVVLLSDHGELLHDHGLTGKGEFHYDSCVRVPLVITGPGVNGGRARDELVQLEDIFPTVLEMAGLPSPDPMLYVRNSTNSAGQYGPSGYPYSPGRSLLDLCRGDDPIDWRDCAYIEHYNNNMGMDGYDPARGLSAPTPASWARSVRTEQWRYTMYPDRCGEQLFNMVDDPEETRNLAGDPNYNAVRLEMRDRLLDLVIKQDYPHSPRSRFSFGIH